MSLAMRAVDPEDVGFGREGAVGVVTLHRPDAINALTLEMVDAVTVQLEDWAEDDDVRAVLIEGRGGKGLCAGGDVVALREQVLAGDHAGAEAFFAAEYAMNRAIATYAKPVIALQHGVVMGGGIGISSHARYRVATHSARFAMPEVAIGFFADVGVNALLAQAMRAPAIAFLLTGIAVEAADAVSLGLTDLAVRDADLPGVRRRLIEAAGNGDAIDTALTAVLQAETRVPGEAQFMRLVESLSDCFEGDSVAPMQEMLDLAAEDGDVGAAMLADRMRRNCPMSMTVNLAAHLAARKSRQIEAVLATDLRLAVAMVAREDFAEGVRAQLIDKDKAPRWSPTRLHMVDRGAVAALIG